MKSVHVGGLYIFNLFCNKASIVTTLKQLLTNRRVLLDGSYSDVTDHNVFAAIEAFRQALLARAIGQVA